MQQQVSILYAEDEPDTRQIMSNTLASEYPDVPLYVAANGAEGLELYRQHRPTLVITDITMPIVDGLKMASEIKDQDPDVELIALTAFSDPGFLMGAIEVGFSHYVLKPVDYDKLFAAIGKSMATLNLKAEVKQKNEKLVDLAAELEKRFEELEESERRFRGTFNQAAVGIGHLAPDGSFLRINHKYCDIVGCIPEEMERLNIRDFTHPDDLEKTLYYHQLLLDGKIGNYTIEKRYIHTDGSIVWVSLTASLVSDASGKPSFVVGVIEDITARKQAEEALRTSELKLSKIFHSVPALIMITNLADSTCLDINEAGLEMLGYQREEVIGHSLIQLGIWEDVTARDQVLESLRKDEMVRDMEVRLKGKKRTMTVLFSTEIIHFEEVPCLLSIVNDISQRKAMEMEIARLNHDLAIRAEQLEKTNRELESFSYTVAHDLRKPLTVINGYSQFVRELCGDQFDQQCRSYIEEIFQGTLRMSRLIDSLLQFSRASHAEIKRSTVDLSGLAEEIAKELRAAEPERLVTVKIAPGLRVEGDVNLLRVVIANLLGNAWKYTSIREDALIELGSFDKDNEKIFFVRDNGVGFDMSQANDLFAPFRRLETGERISGTGIGLATVERVITRHDGRIWAEGVPGHGAVFYFTL